MAVLKIHCAIRSETIKLIKLSDQKYYFQFKFDAQYDCSIVIYICCQELRNANNIPLHFVTSPDLPCPNEYRFSKGMNQEFPPKVALINTAMYRVEDLEEHKEDYYPVVMYIETVYPKTYAGKAKKSV